MLDSRKTGAVRFYLAWDERPPWHLKSIRSRKIFVLLIFRLPVFDTTSPGVGGRLKPRCARHGNLTPPRIAPSRPRAGVSLCTDEVVAKQLVRCFWTGGYRSPPYLAVFDGENPTGGSWRILQGRFALFRRFVRERISVAGCDRARPGVFQGPPGRYRTPPHYLSRFARGLHQTFLLFHHFLELL